MTILAVAGLALAYYFKTGDPMIFATAVALVLAYHYKARANKAEAWRTCYEHAAAERGRGQ